MKIFTAIINFFALTPEEEARHHELELDYGLIEPTAAERAQWQAEDDDAYINSAVVTANVERDVWYEGCIGHVRTYITDQYGRRHYRDDESTFFAGHTGEPPTPDTIYFGEVVENADIVTTTKKGPLSWLLDS